MQPVRCPRSQPENLGREDFRLLERAFASVRIGFSNIMVDGTPDSPDAASHLSSPLAS
jgi:hypothetical protein